MGNRGFFNGFPHLVDQPKTAHINGLDLDTPPENPHPFDDEFNTGVLSPKWTTSLQTGGLIDMTTFPSWLLLKDLANGDNYIQQAIPNANISVTGNFSPGFFSSAYENQLSVMFADASWPTAGNFAAGVQWWNNTGNPRMRLLTYDNFGSGATGDNSMYTGSTQRFFHVQRTTNTWVVGLSEDFITWRFITVSHTFTVTKLRINFYVQNSPTKCRAGMDWVRFNWFSV